MVKKRSRDMQSVGDLVPGALRALGVPSARLTRRVRDAWRRAADEAWVDCTPLRLEGGVLVVGVPSASLRQELEQFHRERLLSVLRAALPDVTLVRLRFTLESPPRGAGACGETS